MSRLVCKVMPDDTPGLGWCCACEEEKSKNPIMSSFLPDIGLLGIIWLLGLG